ncbi:MAG: hypothetical protein UE329_09820 [Lachnospiraceae bacterium]|jgi:hypothetical protein|nr:hypothetical protein [Lachnospiraceae bacterium]
MGGKILRTRTDELIEQGYLKGLELSTNQGVEKERTRMIQTYMSNKNLSFDQTYDFLRDLLDFPEEEKDFYRKKFEDAKK